MKLSELIDKLNEAKIELDKEGIDPICYSDSDFMVYEIEDVVVCPAGRLNMKQKDRETKVIYIS